MDALRQAEILVYLLLLMPKELVQLESPAVWRDWSEQALENLFEDLGPDEALELPDLFSALVSRLKGDLGMHAVGRTQLSFQLSRGFIARSAPSFDLMEQRRRLLERLSNLEGRLQLPAERRSDFLQRSTAIRGLGDAVGYSTGSELVAFLSSPGPGALDNETFGRLLARDTGA